MQSSEAVREREILASVDTYRLWRRDIIRFADLDILGHVNNVAYMVFFETGRVACLEQMDAPPRAGRDGPVFVLAHIAADYLEELGYPGEVEIGTVLRRVGRSSFDLGHGIFHNGVCKAVATSTIVQVEGNPLHSVPLTAQQRRRIERISNGEG